MAPAAIAGSGTLVFGTLSATHFKRMQMSILGNEVPHPDAPQAAQNDHFLRLIVLNDVSISNVLFGLK